MQANKSSTHSVTSAKKFSLTAPMVLRVLLGVVILTIAGQVEIPFFPVPMTLQTLAVFALAMCFRKGEGLASVILYAVIGTAGAPIFAHFEGGVDVLFGTKGGYIVGFVLAAWAWTYFAAKDWGKSLLKTLAAGLVGEVVIYACGLLVLTAMFGFGFAVKVGLVPFLASEAAKWILGSVGIYLFHKRQAK